jgi:uncharacterized protein YndB with AHSA1/START domain
MLATRGDTVGLGGWSGTINGRPGNQGDHVATTTTSVMIGRSVEDVFAVVGDPRTVPSWDRSMASVELTDEEVRLGTRGWMMPRAGIPGLGDDSPRPLWFEVTAFEPPTRIQITSSEGRARATLSWTLAPVAGLPDVTRLTVTMDMEVGGLLRVAQPLVQALMGAHGSSEGLRQLKDLLEREPSTPPLDGR